MTRVLIIDDAAFMRLSLKNMLLNNGFEVVGEAENGAIGIKNIWNANRILLPWILPCRKWTV
jgi:two-component system chemotaxis response regulator CheY